MIRSAAIINPVDRGDAEFRMRPFLQFRLGVAPCAIGPNRAALPITQNELAGHFEAAIQIKRCNQAFDDIGTPP